MNKSKLIDQKDFSVEVTKVDFGSLQAFADLTIRAEAGEVTVKGFRVVHQKGKDAWVALPQTSYLKDGKTINKTVLELPKVLESRVKEAILLGYEEIA
jgi:hypothetical protein